MVPAFIHRVCSCAFNCHYSLSLRCSPAEFMWVFVVIVGDDNSMGICSNMLGSNFLEALISLLKYFFFFFFLCFYKRCRTSHTFRDNAFRYLSTVLFWSLAACAYWLGCLYMARIYPRVFLRFFISFIYIDVFIQKW